MPLYRTDTHYYEVNDEVRVSTREVRVSGAYAPLQDPGEQLVGKRTFYVFVKTRSALTGQKIADAIESMRQRDREMSGY